jgi:phenylacetate-CoA ligase
MKLFDLSLKLAGFPMKEAQKLLAEIRNVSAEDYQAFMEQKKWEIVNYHLKNIYKKLGIHSKSELLSRIMEEDRN